MFIQVVHPQQIEDRARQKIRMYHSEIAEVHARPAGRRVSLPGRTGPAGRSARLARQLY